MENKELTITEFREMWNKAKNINDNFKKDIDRNIIHETTGTTIMADDYDIVHDEFGDIIISLYYKGVLIAEIKLKNIKLVH